MSISSSDRRTADPTLFAGHVSQKSYDFIIFISVAILAIGVVVAIGTLGGSPHINPDELGLITVGP